MTSAKVSVSSSSSLSSSMAANTSRSKRKSLSTIESCVTRLLVSTKHLLESLTQWARQEADDKFVSDAYVKLGNDFRAATRAFTNNGIDISDLGNVPQDLRAILEAALSEAPSQQNLDRFLPDIRNIIVTLLQNLKAKQAKAKAIANEKSARELESQNQSQSQGQGQNQSQSQSMEMQVPTTSRTISGSGSVVDEAPFTESTIRRSSFNDRFSQREHLMTPQRASDRNDALAQLQNGDAMQRRASKRYSAYQYAKLTNFPAQNKFKQMNETTTVETVQFPVKSFETGASKTRNSIEEDSTSEPYILLKINTTTKKVSLTLPTTLAAIRLLFVEKFAYSPGAGNFPEIYIEDPQTKHMYELEDHLIGDVKIGSLICLKEEDTHAKATQDLNSKIEALSQKMETMNNDLIAKLEKSISLIEIPVAAAPPPPPPPPPPSSGAGAGAPATTNTGNHKSNTQSSTKVNNNKEISKVENELRLVKHLNNSSIELFNTKMAQITEKMKNLQESGLEISPDSNRAYMESCHSRLSDDSDRLLTKVDDLQDLMEEVRKDVAQRGVRIGEKQLKYIVNEISDANKALNDISTYITKEKPIWKKIWESELDKVCEEQQFFNLQDDLTNDLQEDLKKIQETFELIEQCSIEQSKGVSSKRNKIVANLHIPEPGESLHNIKDQVLVDIAQLNPNHEGRVEAIERAEKIREKERELSKLTKFQEELGDFVEDNKLKKSGGIVEIENLRMQRDQENLKSSFGII
ncbi:BUD6 [Candida oxycetoniae]|uniref:BUD6 n=1 Tax=Candida oxycetoniae TaxID=497107 RepID=A0AAI9SUJ1_9ASCO|nr:BUD6 [Candida oxycetoniae]KAI3402774.2 BUD6 [Candida oxycetoniae]